MLLKQLSVFVSNKPGQVTNITRFLKDSEVDIRALVLFDTSEFSILRIIVNRPDEALAILKKEGFVAKISMVAAVELEDTLGSLNRLCTTLSENDHNLEYTYCFVMEQNTMPLFVVKTDDTEKAEALLQEKGFRVLDQSEIQQ